MIKYFLKGQQAIQDLERTYDPDDKDRLRGYIVSSIVSFAYEKRFKFTRLQLKEIAADVKLLLPSENAEYYFTPAPPSVMQENLVLKKFSPKGKLYDSYNYSIKTDPYEPKKSGPNDEEVETEIEEIQDTEEQPRSKFIDIVSPILSNVYFVF